MLKVKTFEVSVDESVVTFVNKESDQTYSVVVDKIFVTDKDKIDEVIWNSIYFRKLAGYKWLSKTTIEVEFR
jgi:hypothetical protein